MTELWTCEKVLSPSQLPTAPIFHGPACILWLQHLDVVTAPQGPQGPHQLQDCPIRLTSPLPLTAFSVCSSLLCASYSVASSSSNMLTHSCSAQSCFAELPPGASCPFSSTACHTFMSPLTPATKLRLRLPSHFTAKQRRQRHQLELTHTHPQGRTLLTMLYCHLSKDRLGCGKGARPPDRSPGGH